MKTVSANMYTVREQYMYASQVDYAYTNVTMTYTSSQYPVVAREWYLFVYSLEL